MVITVFMRGLSGVDWYEHRLRHLDNNCIVKFSRRTGKHVMYVLQRPPEHDRLQTTYLRSTSPGSWI